MAEFLTDVRTLRERARHIELGPITEAYGADRERVVSVLNEVLATEIVCVLRYKANPTSTPRVWPPARTPSTSRARAPWTWSART